MTYPSYRYAGLDQSQWKKVYSKEEDDALGPEWSKTYATFLEKPKQEGSQVVETISTMVEVVEKRGPGRPKLRPPIEEKPE